MWGQKCKGIGGNGNNGQYRPEHSVERGGGVVVDGAPKIELEFIENFVYWGVGCSMKTGLNMRKVLTDDGTLRALAGFRLNSLI